MCVLFIVNVPAFYAIPSVLDFGSMRQHQKPSPKAFPFTRIRTFGLKAHSHSQSVTFAAQKSQISYLIECLYFCLQFKANRNENKHPA